MPSKKIEKEEVPVVVEQDIPATMEGKAPARIRAVIRRIRNPVSGDVFYTDKDTDVANLTDEKHRWTIAQLNTNPPILKLV